MSISNSEFAVDHRRRPSTCPRRVRLGAASPCYPGIWAFAGSCAKPVTLLGITCAGLNANVNQYYKQVDRA